MRTGWVLCGLMFLAPTLCALEVQVGSSFKISGITRQKGYIVLPAERKKYHNIRILNQATYQAVKACTQDCRQVLEPVVPSVRQARLMTNRDGWVIEVDFSRAWLITFLVFKDGEDLIIRSPQHFTFLDNLLEQQTRQIIMQAISQNKNAVHL